MKKWLILKFRMFHLAWMYYSFEGERLLDVIVLPPLAYILFLFCGASHVAVLDLRRRACYQAH